MIEILWKENIIGYLVSPKSDNFHVYGKWQPIAGEYLSDFLSILSVAEEESEIIDIEIKWAGNKRKATIGFIPDAYINITFR